MSGYSKPENILAVNFQLVADHLALDFANTLDYRFDPKRRVELLCDYRSFLEFVQQSGIISQRQARLRLLQTSSTDGRFTLRRAILLREALNSLFRSIISGKPPPRSSLRTLNRFLENRGSTESLLWRRSEFLRAYSKLASTPDAPLGPIVDAAADLLTSPERQYIRECTDPSCRWLFLDHSKNHSRRWCDMRTCGNRSKVRRFRTLRQ
jgi:predicted RNA-binding Zn ribbon-like protein